MDVKTRRAMHRVWANLPEIKPPKPPKPPKPAKPKKSRSYDQRRRDSLWNRYKMRESDYAKMMLEHNGFCAICGNPPTGKRNKLHIDHKHGSKVVRGLLCSKCNSGLGFFNDSPAILASAVSYLSKYSQD